MYTLNCRGRLLILEKPVVMGVLNLTPDSFYAGSRVMSRQQVVDAAGDMLAKGATILDLGGQSSRPGATLLNADEEAERVLPALQAVRQFFPDAYISIDTFWSKVAKAAVDYGADIINDISGAEMDPAMITAVAQSRVPYICMHMRGTPATMQGLARYDDLLKEILDYFIRKIGVFREAGIADIVIDPGFGFAKNLDHNYTLLSNLEVFALLQVPLLAGLSRKSMIYKYLDISAAEALHGTTVLNTVALQKGAKILRVHDVEPAVQAIKLLDRLGTFNA
jgi:dihydropteroate synthase